MRKEPKKAPLPVLMILLPLGRHGPVPVCGYHGRVWLTKKGRT